ncbi:MAG TPA: metal-dependent transcriptional regulator [Actinomycetota bacterium]|nr:metal-dependent transcriptional regulator [Actinomycetota bacterium]
MTRHSPAVQDYLKGIYALSIEAPGRPVPTSALAERLAVTPASATNMLKKLAQMGLVEHANYRGAVLTEPGTKIALEVIRHHRLLETYLAEALGVPWDEVHAEAEILEHVLSEELEERIAARLGYPTADPHGHPIPSKDGSMPDHSEQRLWEAGEGSRVAVDRVSDSEAEALRYLGSIGILPGADLEIVGRGPVAGPLYVKVAGSDGDVHALSKELAEAVWVA